MGWSKFCHMTITPSVLDGEVPSAAKPRLHVTVVGGGAPNDLDVVISKDEHIAVVTKHEVAALIVHNVASQMCWQSPSGLWHGQARHAN